MSGPWNIQVAIYSALSGNLTASVYDHVPQDTAFPYVTIGEDIVSEWDTDDSEGFESLITIHQWSRYRGKKEVKTLQREIYDLLHKQDINPSGQSGINLMFESAEVTLDPDGLTYHGIMDFRYITEKT